MKTTKKCTEPFITTFWFSIVLATLTITACYYFCKDGFLGPRLVLLIPSIIVLPLFGRMIMLVLPTRRQGKLAVIGLYLICYYCAYVVICVPHNTVLVSHDSTAEARVVSGFTFAWKGESIEKYWIPRYLEGKTLSVRTSLDSSMILDIHRAYRTNKAYNEAIRAQVIPLLDAPMPTVNKSLSVACQICSMEPYMDSLKQRIDELHFPGLVVKKFDLSYFF